MKTRFPWFGLAVLGFCAWQARDLFTAWRHAPFDRFDAPAFAVWTLPVALAVRRGRAAAGVASPTLLLLAAVGTLLGSALDLNVLQNAALAVALGSFVVSGAALVPWLLAAPAWMPAFGWLTSGSGVAAVSAARLAVAGAASFWACRCIGWPSSHTRPA